MYNSFAYVYDEFMEDVPYESWAKILHKILTEHGIDDGLLLDLGCGTGTLTRLMAEKGYDMTGVDVSEDMLSVAREYDMIGYEAAYQQEDSESGGETENTEDTEQAFLSDDPVSEGGPGREILYLCQDMREFELYGTVRAVYSLCDCLNYITETEDLIRVFRLVNNYLDPGGLFIFDMNSIYKFSTVLGDKTFAENGENASYIWENRYDTATHINEYDITLFIEYDDEKYVKETEIHRQRGYTVDEVNAAIEASGL